MTWMLGGARAIVNQLGGHPSTREKFVHYIGLLVPLGAMWAVKTVKGKAPKQSRPKPIPSLSSALVSLHLMPDPGTGCPAPHPGAN